MSIGCNCMCDETAYCVACGTDEDVRLVDSEDGYVHLCGIDLGDAIEAEQLSEQALSVVWPTSSPKAGIRQRSEAPANGIAIAAEEPQ